MSTVLTQEPYLMTEADGRYGMEQNIKFESILYQIIV